MNILINTLVFLSAFVGMEFVAWSAHKYVMHGFLWNLHEDHHTKDIENVLEKNDYFFLIFATPGITGLLIGTLMDYNFIFYIGLGIAIYGLAYFLIHDVLIHQRIKWFRRANHPYFKAIRKAHKVHHKHLEKEDGECFGMLWVPMKYFREAQR